MVTNNNNFNFTGKAAAVMAGVVCIIVPWLTEIWWVGKILIFFLGISLILIGTRS